MKEVYFILTHLGMAQFGRPFECTDKSYKNSEKRLTGDRKFALCVSIGGWMQTINNNSMTVVSFTRKQQKQICNPFNFVYLK